ncbi:type 4 prepilin-like proteins leader peptide-processing enzyme [Pseudoalteromonas tetraodonis GFC]|uniref:Prepilin leader peptidase/N-methyltransferase n=1 Tax=Pseudoalteromonas tetraodonis GFC TaxID=1315271 RepID=A0AA37S1E2_9GAMM|nr:A24 family peptidase [Pseudoalteromonas tetraodonis]ATD04345.1 leader peptidase (prepilin peptidase) / N-methyltransferase [Pseudoalteromonas tetraodonis]GEN39626.1 type 4 prepilin-like proteins leader peptide-processing enzyme [Pseudoalteromonas tetraodonis GFC]GLQ02248.1 type 4 prepilin-like proteins leader peptide-processing enzyme [Pseudoalteromonas tetraodonis GFC]
MHTFFIDITAAMQSHLWFYLTTIGLVSLCIGSFLNVVIYRLPLMMQKEWQTECRLLLADELTSPKAKQTTSQTTDTFNLVKPNSCCPKCKAAIKPWQNIPIISWLFLKGKCATCNNPISVRYPIVEAITAILSLVVAYTFGATEQALLYIVVTWALVALTFIDIDHMLLPDQLTLPLLWLALIASVMGYTIAPSDAIIGAACGYLSLWSVFWLFKLITGKEGMGYGDFKLLAVFGAILGWQSLLTIILLSSVVGAVIGIALLSIQGKDKATPIPFGPYLAIAGWFTMLWGTQLQNSYFNFIGY